MKTKEISAFAAAYFVLSQAIYLRAVKKWDNKNDKYGKRTVLGGL